MPVHERLMQSGAWSLKLSPDTPKTIRDLIDYFGHIYIFDGTVRPGLADATMITLSRWGGIVRIKLTPWDVGGVNMICWLGDEDGKGPIYETAVTSTNATFSTTITNLINFGSGSVHVGSIGAGGPTRTTTYQWVTPRAAIDNVCALFAGEYRVNKDATLDAGSSSFLFKVTPTAVAMRRSSGRDQNVTGLSVTQLDVSIDAEEHYTRALVQDSTLAWTGRTGSLFARYLGPDTDGTLRPWTIDAGVPTIASNVVTMPISSRMHAGLANWTNIQPYVRFTWSTGSKPVIAMHTDAGANAVQGWVDGVNIYLYKQVAGVATNVGQAAQALVNGTSYWLNLISVGTGYQANIFSDVAGKIGASLQTTGAFTIADAALQTGPIGLANGLNGSAAPTGTCTFGGPYINVCVVPGDTPYRDLNGNALQLSKVFLSPLTPAASAADLANNLSLASVLRQQVILQTDEFDIDRNVAVGDYIWVYDADGTMVDPANQVRYRGSIIYPITLRVLGITWPIERGMGVWYRDKAGVWTDITNFVIFEQPGVAFEVGAPIRPLVKS